MKVLTVLRKGGEFTAFHVYAIRRMLKTYTPAAEFFCLTDETAIPGPWRIPLQHDWPGWFAKLELCRPDIEGPFLFMDLDTVIVGDVTPLLADPEASLSLRDLYRGRRRRNALQSALMHLSDEDRALVWEHFMSDPRRHMRRRSDQEIYEAVLKDRVRYFQDTHPGAVVGFKSDLFKRTAPGPDVRIVVFHGKPRPWACGQDWAEMPFKEFMP